MHQSIALHLNEPTKVRCVRPMVTPTGSSGAQQQVASVAHDGNKHRHLIENNRPTCCSWRSLAACDCARGRRAQSYLSPPSARVQASLTLRLRACALANPLPVTSGDGRLVSRSVHVARRCDSNIPTRDNAQPEQQQSNSILIVQTQWSRTGKPES